MANCCGPSSRMSGTPLTATDSFVRPGGSTSSASVVASEAWELRSTHRTSAVGGASPAMEKTNIACERSSDVLPSMVAASINEEQSDPVHPPLQTHTEVGMQVPLELQSFGHDARTDGGDVAADAVGEIGAPPLLTAKPLRSHICVGSAVDLTVGTTVGSVVPDSTNCNWRGDGLVGPSLGSGVGWMVCVGALVVGASVSVGRPLGVAVGTDGMSVVGNCDGIPVDGTSEGRSVIGAALLGSSLGADVVGADDGSIVVGRALGREVGYQVGPGDVGSADGSIEGSKVGSRVGTSEGVALGGTDWSEGATEGSKEGGLVGTRLGLAEGADVGSWEG